jgi:hypothetical protein
LPRSNSVAEVTQPTVHARPPGSSTEQRNAERVMLDLLGQDLGIRLDPATITVASGERVEVDGTDTERTVLVECWATRDPQSPRNGTRSWPTCSNSTGSAAPSTPGHDGSCVSATPEAAAPFLPSTRSWAARALQDLDIDV